MHSFGFFWGLRPGDRPEQKIVTQGKRLNHGDVVVTTSRLCTELSTGVGDWICQGGVRGIGEKCAIVIGIIATCSLAAI